VSLFSGRQAGVDEPELAAFDDDASREAAERTERENPGWIVVFGTYTRQFVCFPGSRRRPERLSRRYIRTPFRRACEG
jgi:hypothetical protein